MQELISVIVPVYNTEEYLRRCVQSILAQTYRNLEVILVDDGSKDKSGLICDSLSAEDRRIHVIHQINSGVSAARNAGMNVATGSFITFVDSDDYLHPGMIERLYRLLEENGADISSCEYTSDESELLLVQDTTSLTFDTANGISDMLCNEHITYSVCCKLFSHTTVNGVRFHTEYSHHEDLLFCYEAFLQAGKIVHSCEMLYLYYINPASATHSSFSHKRITAIDVQDRILSDIGRQFGDSELYRTAEQQYLKVNIYTLNQMLQEAYNNRNDYVRVRRNIRKRIRKLLRGDLAKGYKVLGVLFCVCPRVLLYYLIR